MLNFVAELLARKGYSPIDDEMEGILFREIEDRVYVVTLSESLEDDEVSDYHLLQRKMEYSLGTKFCKQVSCLHFVATEDGDFDEAQLALANELPNLWFAAEDTGRIYLFERQITDFDGLYDYLEHALTSQVERVKKETAFRITPVNAAIVILNVLYYIVILIVNQNLFAAYDADIMLSMGAMSNQTVLDGAWYQLVTSMFLHFGVTHLINNMILLAYTGCELERRIGSIPYLILYMASGILGNVASFFYYQSRLEPVVSAGASGAIYGVLGALLVVLVVRQIRTPDLSPRRIFLMIGLTIYHGMTSTGVDNAAHVGGLVTGIVIGFILSKISRYDKLEEVNFMR